MSQTRVLKGIDLYGQPASAEDAFRISAVRMESQERHEKAMLHDAAKRVVWANCMTSCDIAPEQIKNFDSNFYYNQLKEQEMLQTCFNDKMEMHFGREYAEKEDLFINFKTMKAQF